MLPACCRRRRALPMPTKASVHARDPAASTAGAANEESIWTHEHKRSSVSKRCLMLVTSHRRRAERPLASRRLVSARQPPGGLCPQLARSSPRACGALAHSAGRPSLDYLRRCRPLDDNVHPTADRPLFAGPPVRRSKKLPLVTVRAEGNSGPSAYLRALRPPLPLSPRFLPRCGIVKYRIG